MADLKFNIGADAQAAQQAFAQLAQAAQNLNDAAAKLTPTTRAANDEVGKSVVKWQEMANAAKAAVAMVVKFGVDAVKAYAESERVQKQLTRAAGDYADALGEQAEAMSRLYAVDDDIIKQSATLLTQWGGVGAATRDVQQAILDYAAATGQDAVAATQDLIRNVESGGAGLAKMGVRFETTGDKGKDLAAAVGALSGKFGGAAGANAESLQGSLDLAGMAFEDLVKDIGGSIAAMAQQSGVVGQLTEAIRGLRTMAFGDQEQEKREERLKLEEHLLGRLEYRKELEGQIRAARKMGSAEDIARLEDFYQRNEAGIEQAKRMRAEMNAAIASGGVAGVQVTGETNKGGKDREATEAAARAAAEHAKSVSEKVAEQTRADMKRDEEMADQARAEQVQGYAAELQNTANYVKDRVKLQQDASDGLTKIRLEEEKKAAEIAERQAKREAEIHEQSTKEERERLARREAQAKAAGDQIGAAFVNAMADQLAKLAEGGEFDAALFVGDVLASVVGVAAGIIGTAYGMPALGAAVGNIASMGIRTGFGAMSASAKKASAVKQYHSGGWVGDEAELPRYHSGAWIGGDEQAAILQTGERVLSRSEVARMGGKSGVDGVARGRGGVTVNITAIDSKSAADSFASDMGRGMRLALRRGQGDLPSLMGAGPR